jgi:hypothetical protein
VGLLLERLQQETDRDTAAVCLEAFGPGIGPLLAPLVDHPQGRVRFAAARILVRFQDGLGLRVLEPIALDDASELQEAAVRAIGEFQGPLTVGMLTRALGAKSARVRIAAWKALMKVSPGATIVAAYPDKFILSRVPTGAGPFVYVARADEPHLALFGDVRVRPPTLAQTRNVTASAMLGADRLTIVAQRAGRTIRLETPLDLEAAVRVMAAPLTRENETQVTGLDLGYSDVVSIIYQMAQRKALTGPMVLQPLEYRAPVDRPVTAPPVSAEGPAPGPEGPSAPPGPPP